MKSINVRPFGQLQADGSSSVWRGSTQLQDFDGTFAVILRGEQHGPSPEQTHAAHGVDTNSGLLKLQATSSMIELHRDCGLLPPEVQEMPARIWDFLRPEFIEVCDSSYYKDGRIFIAIAFASTQAPDFLPAIETADGAFVQVLSGT